MKHPDPKPALRSSSQDANRTAQQEFRALAFQSGKRSDDWLSAGDWLAAGEKLKSHSPRYKS